MRQLSIRCVRDTGKMTTVCGYLLRVLCRISASHVLGLPGQIAIWLLRACIPRPRPGAADAERYLQLRSGATLSLTAQVLRIFLFTRSVLIAWSVWSLWYVYSLEHVSITAFTC